MAATITDETLARPAGRGTAVPRTTGPAVGPARRGRGRRGAYRGRTGSRQVVSRRGRRLTNTTEDKSAIRFSVVAIAVFVTGIVLAMILSGLSTTQSIQLTEARQQEQSLRDGIEVLERDVEYQRSTAEIARQAAEFGMVNVEQPMILVTDENGVVHEVRAGSPEHQRIVDINGDAVRPDAPTSDPDETRVVPGMQAPAIQEANPAAPQLPALAPYAPAPAGPAPAPAPTPEVNPVDEAAPAVD